MTSTKEYVTLENGGLFFMPRGYDQDTDTLIGWLSDSKDSDDSHICYITFPEKSVIEVDIDGRDKSFLEGKELSFLSIIERCLEDEFGHPLLMGNDTEIRLYDQRPSD